MPSRKSASCTRAKDDFETSARHTLDFVDETTKESVKADTVEAAHKLGIDVLAGNIDVVYEDADEPATAQRLGAQFTTKRVVISLRYVAHVMGLPVHQQITASKFRQVTAPVKQPNKTTPEQLDNP